MAVLPADRDAGAVHGKIHPPGRRHRRRINLLALEGLHLLAAPGVKLSPSIPRTRSSG